MKSLILALIALTVTAPALAGHDYHDQLKTSELVCFYSESSKTYDRTVSCVSKASIEKDKAELELIKLQIAEIKSKQESKTNKKKK